MGGKQIINKKSAETVGLNFQANARKNLRAFEMVLKKKHASQAVELEMKGMQGKL